MPKEFANSQALVGIENIRQNTVILKNGGLRQILMVGGINFALKSESEQNGIIGAYQNFLNSVDFPLQIIVHSRKININKYLSSLEQRVAEEPSELLKKQIYEYSEFIRSFIEENPIMTKTFFVIVPFNPVVLPKKEMFQKYIPFLKQKNGERLRQGKEAEIEREEDFRRNSAQLQQRVNQVAQGLQIIGLEVKILGDEELIELFYNFYNPEAIERKETIKDTNE